MRLAALVPDLFFATRIAEAAGSAGAPLTALQGDLAAMLEALRREPPDLLMLDLVAPAALPLARAIRAEPALAGVRTVGFYAHVDEPTRSAAQAAGVDQVLPRSTFTRRLPELLSGR
jgi:CheY-like chemotaxis protein